MSRIRVFHECGSFISLGSFFASMYSRAVFRSIPDRIAASPICRCFLISSISLLTCASFTVTAAPSAGTSA